MTSTNYTYSLAFAQEQDRNDPLRHFRSRFLFPQHQGREVVYFTGNSLGLQSLNVREALEYELQRWATLGVEGHFQGEQPWVSYHKQFEQPLARIVGALPSEVVAMNALTVNLHLLLASFYRPTTKRWKILCEAGAFPSDQYALETQARWHGLDPASTVIELAPRDGEHTLRHDDILRAIEEHGSTLALVMFSGVQYYTGQVFDIASLTKAAHAVGALAGFDLAHAVGNVVLSLHGWDVDFAAWCSYKYLNSSPGGVAGAFVHERHAVQSSANPQLLRLAGWWGNEEQERFKMEKGFRPAQGAQSWQTSNSCILAMAVHKAALDIFDETSIPELRRKSERLTGFLEFVIDEVSAHTTDKRLEIITPRAPHERGCQLSLFVHGGGKAVFERLSAQGVVVDWREPNVIRAAPAPLYNSFEDVWRFGEALRSALQE
jgi:kynureninase